MNSGGLMGGMYRFCEWIMRFTVTNILWLLFSLPIVYLALNTLFVKTSGELQVNLITIAVLMPFFFFPATTAMFGVVRKWVIGEGDAPLIRSYWKFYKENFVRSMVGGLLIVLIWAVLLVDYMYFAKTNPLLFYIFLAIGIFVLVFTMHFFSNTVHFHLTLMHTFKNSMLLALGRPLHTLCIAIAFVIILYLSFALFTFLIPFCMGSLIAFLSFSIYYRSVVKMQEQQEPDGDAESA